MGIKRQTPQRQIEQYTRAEIQKLEQRIAKTLMYIGEQCVNEARDSGAYINQTGNLRSSIGYVILHDGEVVVEPEFIQYKDGQNGVERGKDFIKELIARTGKGFSLIVVAGMEYAAYVEAKGLNVLSSSELKAIDMTPRMLRKIGFK